MSKELGTLLERELKRYKSIVSYNDRTINETVYSFYNEAEEDVPAIEPGTDPSAMADPSMGADPNAPAPQPDVANQIATAEPGADITAQDQAVPDMGGDPNAQGVEPSVEPAMGQPEMGGGAPGGDVEIDVTEIVNDTKKISQQTERALNRLQMVYDRLHDVDNKLSKMDDIIMQMGQLEKQVALMRPPTEAERRKALADKSYPYSVTDTDYLAGVGYKNQTDMEKKPNKMSMIDNLTANYDPNAIKKSFHIDGDDDNREAKNF